MSNSESDKMKSAKSANSGNREAEMEEMWGVVAGTDTNPAKEDEEEEVPKNVCVNPPRKRKEKKEEQSAEECIAIVEQLLAIFEVAAEDDAELNRQEKPCLNKLRKLPLLIDALTKKRLQKHFIDRGILTLLKNWLEPLPDGSLPNLNIRQAILYILTEQLWIDLDQFFVRKQLADSGLGKAIMFLSQSEEETASNRKLARELVYEWSRAVFNISTRYEDARPTYDDERMHKRPCIRKPTKKADDMADDFARVSKQTRVEPEIYEFSARCKYTKTAKSYSDLRAKAPEPTPLTYVIRPPSKVIPKKCIVENNKHQESIVKKYRHMKAMQSYRNKRLK